MDTLKGLDEINAHEWAPSRRQVTVSYRTEDVQVPVSGINDEVMLQFASVLRGLAVQQGVLSKAPFEDLVMSPTSWVKFNRKVPASMVEDAEDSRRKLAKYIADAAVGSSDQFLEAPHYV